MQASMQARMAVASPSPASPPSHRVISRASSKASQSQPHHHLHRKHGGTIRRLSVVFHRALSSAGKQPPDTDEAADSSSVFVNCRPESLSQLCQVTKFSKREIQLMYRGFKQGCPTGAVSLDQFKEIYGQFFPQVRSDPGQYAIYVFNTFDRDQNGRISFEEFVCGLSTLSRGTTEEKLRWVFDLYDIDRDGLLTKKDIEKIISSLYGMMGSAAEPPIEPDTVQKHIDYIFSKMDENGDGSITLQEFIESCQKDESIADSMNLFDTRLHI